MGEQRHLLVKPRTAALCSSEDITADCPRNNCCRCYRHCETFSFVFVRKHPAEHHRAVVHAVLSAREEQRDGVVRPQPARRRQEPHQPRPPPHPSEDRRGRRRAPQDPGGEEGLRPELLADFTWSSSDRSTSPRTHMIKQTHLYLSHPGKSRFPHNKLVVIL